MLVQQCIKFDGTYNIRGNDKDSFNLLKPFEFGVHEQFLQTLILGLVVLDGKELDGMRVLGMIG